MVFKNFYVILFACLLAFSLTACSDDGDDDDDAKAPSEEVLEMNGDVVTAVGQAMQQIYSNKAPTTVTVSEEGDGWTAEGTYEMDMEAGIYTYEVTLTWDSYVHQDVTLESGTVNAVMVIVSDGNTMSMTYDYTGDFVVIYQGETHDFSWDMSVETSGQNVSLSGTFTIDGTTYSYSEVAR